MPCAFVDAEFTGEHAFTTLVSIALVSEGDDHLVVAFDDYAEEQVTPWLRENVLQHIDPATRVDRTTGFRLIADWLDAYAGEGIVSLVSAGKMMDLILLFELWHIAHPELTYFHHLHALPPCINHTAHFDLPTVFYLAGLDPMTDREQLAGDVVHGRRHDPLYDALLVRECFRRCVTAENFPRLAQP